MKKKKTIEHGASCYIVELDCLGSIIGSTTYSCCLGKVAWSLASVSSSIKCGQQ